MTTIKLTYVQPASGYSEQQFSVSVDGQYLEMSFDQGLQMRSFLADRSFYSFRCQSGYYRCVIKCDEFLMPDLPPPPTLRLKIVDRQDYFKNVEVSNALFNGDYQIVVDVYLSLFSVPQPTSVNSLLGGGGGGISSVSQVSGQTVLSPNPIVSTGTIGLATHGTAGTYPYPSSLVTDSFGRVTSVVSGSPPSVGVTSVSAGLGLSASPSNPITSTGTLNMTNTGVTPGSYSNANVTVDAQGRITTASSGSGGSGGFSVVYFSPANSRSGLPSNWITTSWGDVVNYVSSNQFEVTDIVFDDSYVSLTHIQISSASALDCSAISLSNYLNKGAEQVVQLQFDGTARLYNPKRISGLGLFNTSTSNSPIVVDASPFPSVIFEQGAALFNDPSASVAFIDVSASVGSLITAQFGVRLNSNGSAAPIIDCSGVDGTLLLSNGCYIERATCVTSSSGFSLQYDDTCQVITQTDPNVTPQFSSKSSANSYDDSLNLPPLSGAPATVQAAIDALKAIAPSGSTIQTVYPLASPVLAAGEVGQYIESLSEFANVPSQFTSFSYRYDASGTTTPSAGRFTVVDGSPNTLYFNVVSLSGLSVRPIFNGFDIKNQLLFVCNPATFINWNSDITIVSNVASGTNTNVSSTTFADGAVITMVVQPQSTIYCNRVTKDLGILGATSSASAVFATGTSGNVLIGSDCTISANMVDNVCLGNGVNCQGSTCTILGTGSGIQAGVTNAIVLGPYGDVDSSSSFNVFEQTTQSTAGSGASVLPLAPEQFWVVHVNGQGYAIPMYPLA